MYARLKNGVKKIKKRTKLPLMVGRQRLPHQIPGNVLSLLANRPTPTSGTMSPWADQSRGYEVSCTNAATNGDFAVDTNADGLADGWSKSSAAIATFSPGAQTLLPQLQFNALSRNVSCAIGDKLVAVITMDSPDANTYIELGGTAPIYPGVASNVTVATSIRTAASSTMMFQIGSNKTSGWLAFVVKRVLIVNLTTAFTAGREPSVPDSQRAMEDAGTTYWNGTKTLRFRNNAALSNFAGSATSGWVQEWIECQTGQDKSVVNLLGNAGNMIDANLNNSADGWVLAGSTAVSCIAGEFTFLPNVVNGQTYASSPVVQDADSVYGFAYVKATKSTAKVKLTGGVVSANFTAHSGGGAYEFLSSVGLKSGTGTCDMTVFDSASSGWANITVKQAGVISKTGIFAGMTQAEMDRIVQRAITAYGYINTKTLKLARRWMIRLDGSDDFMSLVNSASLDLGVVAGKEQAWAVTFRVAQGAQAGYLLCKNLSSFSDAQYSIAYQLDGRLELYLNGGVRAQLPAGSIATNEFYNVVFYRNGAGGITPYLNKVAKPTATYANALTTQPNVRIGRRETAGGHFKGDMFSEQMYEADKLDINQILRAEWNVARDYIA